MRKGFIAATLIASGLIISLIPNMVKDYNEKNNASMNQTFNKCLKIILLIIAPISIFMSIMSNSLWNTFYMPNKYGSLFIKYSLIATIFCCLYIVMNSILQSIGGEKVIYKGVIIGQLTNIIFDIPLMYLFHIIGLPAYYGAISATLLCFVISSTISIYHLNKQIHLDCKETVIAIPKFIISVVILVIILKIFNSILPIDSSNKLVQFINILISGIVSGGIYLLINFKSICSILPPKILNRLHITN